VAVTDRMEVFNSMFGWEVMLHIGINPNKVSCILQEIEKTAKENMDICMSRLEVSQAKEYWEAKANLFEAFKTSAFESILRVLT